MLIDGYPWYFLRLFEAEGVAAGGGDAAAAPAGDPPPTAAPKDDAAAKEGESDDDSGDSGDGGDEATGEGKAAIWGDNWRNDIVGGLGLDGDALKKAKGQAERWTSPLQMAKSALSASQKITELTESTKGMVKVPGKGATDEEKAAFNKALGVPDKPDAYELPPTQDGEEREMSQFEEVTVEAFKEDALKAGLSQAQFAAVHKSMERLEDMARQHLDAEGERLKEAVEDKLRVEWGAEYKGNMELANRFLAERMPDADNILGMRLVHGPALGAYEPFLKMVVELAREHSDDGALISGVTPEGMDISKRIEEIYDLRIKDKAKYNSKEVQDELVKLTGLQSRRKNSGGQTATEQ
jgi:hypothetical protein